MMDHRSGRIARGVLLAAAYAAIFLAVRASNITLDQWYLPAGVRVAALLACPRRYWPYLVLGEAVALLTLRYPQLHNYGPLFVVVASITIMPLVACIVRFLERPARTDLSTQNVLTLAALVAVSTTAANSIMVFGLMRNIRAPLDWTNSFQVMVGAYLGILTVAPLVLLWKTRNAIYPFPRKFRNDATIGIAAIAAAYFACQSVESIESKNLLRLFMIAPALALTVMHGWRGAAAGVVAANTALAMTIARTHTDGNTDQDALLVQMVLAVASTILFSLGAAISRYYRNSTMYGAAEARALEIARQSFVASEKELERRAADMHFLMDEVAGKLHEASDWLKKRGHAEAALEIQNFRMINESRIRNDLLSTYPSHLADGGLYSTIAKNPNSGKWGGQSVVTSFLRGDDRALGPDLQLMVYRALDDLVALLAITGHREITIKARCRRGNGYSGIAVCITSRDGLRSAIDQVGDLDASGRVLAYGGRIRRRGRRIHLVMIERHHPVNAPAFA